MKRRGWWIAGGIVLLWLSPLLWAICKSSFFPERQDYSQYWADRAKMEEAERFNRLHGRYYNPRYSAKACGDSEPTRRVVEVEAEPVVVEKPVYVERVVYRDNPSYQSSQPDLTGIYWQRNFGTFQYVMGPF